MVRQIPNIITLLNLFCGSWAALAFFKGQNKEGIILICIALIADYFDGALARKLKVNSEMGKQLDSLADMVSFGFVPSVIMYQLIHASREVSIQRDYMLTGWVFDTPDIDYAALPALLIAVFSAYRLAKFNLDTRQSENFIGLATPANTLFIMGLLLVSNTTLVANINFLYILVAASSYLLVSEIEMFGLKFKTFDWETNKMRFIFLALAAVILVFTFGKGISVIIFLYIMVNILNGFLKK